MLVITGVYGSLFAASWAVMGYAPIPPLLAADTYLYVVFSGLSQAGPGAVMNPWYHTPAAGSDVIYLSFGLAFSAFRWLHHALGASPGLTLLAWTVLWTLLICGAARWLVSALADRPPFGFVALALGLLVLVDVDFFRLALARVVYPQWRYVGPFATLPYGRPFFPQVAIPLLLAYVGLQLRVFREPRWTGWLALGALQLVALACFPHATLVMAALTGIGALVLAARGRPTFSWLALIAFGLGCVAVDLWFLRSRMATMGLFAGQVPAFRFDGVRLRALLGFTFLAVLGLTLLVAVVARRRPEVRGTLVGLGAGTSLLLVSDTVIATGFQTSVHVGYLVHTIVAVLAISLCAEIQERLGPAGLTAWRRVMAVGAIGAVAYGGLAAYSTFAWYRSDNGARGALVREAALTGPGDLWIAPNDLVQDEVTWLPLVSNAEVLFVRGGEFIMSPAGRARESLGLGLFLYFRGEAAESVQALLREKDVGFDQRFLAGYRRLMLLSSSDRERVIDEVRRELVPVLRAAEGRSPEVVRFLRRFRRVFVVDRVGGGFFQTARLEEFVGFQGKRDVAGQWVLRWGEPR